jgi:hypothetical protein
VGKVGSGRWERLGNGRWAILFGGEKWVSKGFSLEYLGSEGCSLALKSAGFFSESVLTCVGTGEGRLIDSSTGAFL